MFGEIVWLVNSESFFGLKNRTLLMTDLPLNTIEPISRVHHGGFSENEAIFMRKTVINPFYRYNNLKI